MPATLDYQLACDDQPVPSALVVQEWLNTIFVQRQLISGEVTIRIVESSEGQALNHAYRQKDSATNVLSFPFEAPEGITMDFLGDIVICAEVVNREAETQHKTRDAHWAHMVVHGVLHLLGFDHTNEVDAEQMEALEVEILNTLGIDDPYTDRQ